MAKVRNAVQPIISYMLIQRASLRLRHAMEMLKKWHAFCSMKQSWSWAFFLRASKFGRGVIGTKSIPLRLYAPTHSCLAARIPVNEGESGSRINRNFGATLALGIVLAAFLGIVLYRRFKDAAVKQRPLNSPSQV